MSQIIKLKRSQTLGKRILAADLSEGELFVNYHQDEPGVFVKDNGSPSQLRKVGSAHVGVNPPNNNPLSGTEQGVSEGELWFCTDPTDPNFENLLIYVGGEWKAAISSIAQI